MDKKQLKSAVLLLIATIIWGAAFSAQKASGKYVGPFTFHAVRYFLGGLVLLPFVLIKNKQSVNPNNDGTKIKTERKTLIKGGLICGLVLAFASLVQQLGIAESSPGKSGFLTALYIILVPIAVGLFFRKKVKLTVWFGAFLAVFGMNLLCMSESISFSTGDIFLLACAVGYTGHILVIDHYASKVDGVELSCIQFFVCSFVSVICMFIFEKPTFSGIISAWIPILYTGVLSCGVAYTFQTLSQKNLHPAFASLIMSLESVFSALFGFICFKLGWINEGALSSREVIGCVIVFVAILLAQSDVLFAKRKK